MFSVKKYFKSSRSRIGKLHYGQEDLLTPLLFPVVCLVTGTTARGGGLWKYILQADTSNGLLRRNLPVLSQVLHFLDFIPTNVNSLTKWRELGIRERYRDEVSPSVKYNAPLFLDSGGFKLLWKNTVDLSVYGLSLEDGKGFGSILELQESFGGDIIATLDYPLPPGLARIEAEERMQKSLHNAVQAASLLQQKNDWKPFLYVAAHAQERAGMRNYVKRVFDEFSREELKEYSFGLAIGSLVPLRGGHKYSIIIDLIRGLHESIPDSRRDKTPIHVFGITGSLIPILAYLGVDTFDSSSYIQEGRTLSYIDPERLSPRPILEMDELNCNCCVCQQANLEHIKDALTSNIRGRPVHNGHYKSKYYADIALHNLEMDFGIVNNTRNAIQADSLQEFIIEHTEKFAHLRHTLDVIANEDDDLRIRLSRTIISIPKEVKKDSIDRAVSLKYNSGDFDILSNGYKPHLDKRILLIIPCSGGKPYSQSRSHRLVAERLEQALGERTKLIYNKCKSHSRRSNFSLFSATGK